MNQKTLLLVMVLAVPVLVGVSGIVSFALLRMGYGVFVWAVLPFLGLLLAVAVLGLILGRTISRGNGGASGEDRGGDQTRPRNGV